MGQKGLTIRHLAGDCVLSPIFALVVQRMNAGLRNQSHVGSTPTESASRKCRTKLPGVIARRLSGGHRRFALVVKGISYSPAKAKVQVRVLSGAPERNSMPRVKIVFVSEHFGEYDEKQFVVREDLPWEDVTDEELKLLQVYISRIDVPYRGLFPKLLVQDPISVQEHLTTIRAWIANREAKEIREQKERDAAKRKRQVKKVKDKRALLEQLKKELGEA